MSIAQIKCHQCTNKTLHNKFQKRGSSCGSALNECKESDNCAMWNKLRTNYNVAVPRDMVMRKLREPLIQRHLLSQLLPNLSQFSGSSIISENSDDTVSWLLY